MATLTDKGRTWAELHVGDSLVASVALTGDARGWPAENVETAVVACNAKGAEVIPNFDITVRLEVAAADEDAAIEMVRAALNLLPWDWFLEDAALTPEGDRAYTARIADDEEDEQGGSGLPPGPDRTDLNLHGPDGPPDALTMTNVEVHWYPGDGPTIPETHNLDDGPGYVAFARLSDGTLCFPMSHPAPFATYAAAQAIRSRVRCDEDGSVYVAPEGD